MICHGLTNKEIARRLEISVRTVETHRLNIRTKTAATTNSRLVQVANLLGINTMLPLDPAQPGANA